MTRPLSPEVTEACELAVKVGVPEAARRTGLYPPVIYAGCHVRGLTPLPDARTVRTDADRRAACERSTTEGLAAVARELGVTRESVRQWRIRYGYPPMRRLGR